MSKKISSDDKVANDKFAEWTQELTEYHDDSLRAASQKQLNDSKVKYDQLHQAMLASESKMQPVLDKFHNAVLTLKHDLNAAAISSLQSTSVDIDNDVQKPDQRHGRID